MVNRAKTSGNDGNAVVIERQYGPYTVSYTHLDVYKRQVHT